MSAFTATQIAKAIDTQEPDEFADILLETLGYKTPGDEGCHAEQMWYLRRKRMIAAVAGALRDLRDRNGLDLTPQVLREHLHLGLGVDAKLFEGQPESISTVPEEAMEDLRRRTGILPLYLRAARGEMSDAARLRLQGFFDTLPKFSMGAALTGKPQDPATIEIVGFLTMPVSKPLGELLDDGEKV